MNQNSEWEHYGVIQKSRNTELSYRRVTVCSYTKVLRYSFVPNCRGSNKMYQEKGKLSRFLKLAGGGVFLSHSLIIIKWSWGFFSQNLQFDTPLPPTISQKRVWIFKWALSNEIPGPIKDQGLYQWAKQMIITGC